MPMVTLFCRLYCYISSTFTWHSRTNNLSIARWGNYSERFGFFLNWIHFCLCLCLWCSYEISYVCPSKENHLFLSDVECSCSHEETSSESTCEVKRHINSQHENPSLEFKRLICSQRDKAMITKMKWFDACGVFFPSVPLYVHLSNQILKNTAYNTLCTHAVKWTDMKYQCILNFK